MARIAMNIAKLNAASLGAKLQISLTAIAADTTTFTGATSLLTLGNTKRTALADADALVESLAAQLAQAREARRQQFDEVADFYEHDLINYVNGIAHGDANIILLAGLDVAQTPGPSPAMSKVEAVTLTAGPDDGKAFADWKRMLGSRSYEVQTSSNVNDPTLWTTYDVVVNVGLEIEGLSSGQKRWVRVRAINNVNKGPWSDPACCTVP